MIYVFYTSIALAAIISVGTIKAQMAHIKGLKQIYKDESRKAHELQLHVLELSSELRACKDVQQTWAKRAQEITDEQREQHMQHEAEMELMRTKIWEAGEPYRRVKEQKRLSAIKNRKAKSGK